MSSITMPRTLAVTAVLVAAGVVLWSGNRAPRDESPIAPRAADLPPSRTSTPDAAVDESGEAAAAARLRELNQMSETFRNTTFLIAIRDAGFLCNELLSVYGGVNDSTTWTANCSEMLAYTVRVAHGGGLGVEPLLSHLDGVLWSPTRTPGSETVLPPQSGGEILLPPRR